MADQNTNIIILTATITPPKDAIKLARTDPELRLKDYQQALEFYLECLSKKIITGIVFADNSASDISSLQKLCHLHNLSDKVELLSFSGLDYPPSYGRGYGEFKLIDYVMSHSKLIKQLPENANIWKVTGRYILVNLQAIIKTRPKGYDLYCHCRNIPIRWTDLYVLGWNKKSYSEILNNIYTKIKEDDTAKSAEQHFREIIDKDIYQSKIYKRFKTVPELKGVRGVDGRGYQDMNYKVVLRKILNKILPCIWI